MAQPPNAAGLAAFSQLGAQEAAQSGNSNTNAPFIMNPGNGQFTSNPGFLNKLQQLDLYLTQNPQVAAQLQNYEQQSSMVSPTDLQNYRNPQTGQTPPPGITYGQLQSEGYVAMSAPQQQQNLGITNAQGVIGSATNASNNVSTGIVDLGSALDKIGLGFIANALPGYSTYKQAIGSLNQNPYTQAAGPIFGNQGVTPSSSPGSPLGSLLGSLGVLQQGANGVPSANPPAPAPITTSPLNPSALNPIPSPNLNPYSGTANSVITNPAQLGANARAAQGL